ncbi:2-phosphosulfolactate phosphatase [Aeromicrobium sp. CTD01-1L150]|uniref:2-phosphosulfolactate phosphatase n=1 Tax=Aeromicrobium sp. CTD01-1L150 TaxID=3341830 RepID=UPI0035C0C9B1
MAVVHGQLGHPVRLEWGETGGIGVARGVDVVVVVDVLTFCTTVTIAVEQGSMVVPCREGDDDLPSLAAQRNAVLAHAGATDGPGPGPSGVSVAPPERLLLADGGSDVVVSLRDVGTTVVAACLRNAVAVADWIAREHDAEQATVAVVAAGARWPDGSLRPALEDLWGAGAVLAALEDHGWPGLSPEAAQAADARRLVQGRELEHLNACAGGQELLAAGGADDLELAGQVGASSVVPLLGDRGFVPAP